MTRTLFSIVLLSAFALGCHVEDKSGPTPRKKRVDPKASAAEVPLTPPVEPVPPLTVKAAPVVLPPATKPPLIRITGIRSDKPQSSPDKALRDAIQVAQYRLMESLQKLDPPVMVKPRLTKIHNEYLKKDSIRETQPTAEQKEKLKEQGLEANRYWVEIDIEVTEAQVQRLRASERVNDGIRGAGLLLALVAAVYGFLRLDAWSKGYLTLWLGLGAVVAVGFVTYLMRL